MDTSNRINYIKRLFSEGEEYLARGDIIQSSEKFYKGFSEAIICSYL
jgi:hypothetical protein